LLFLFEAAGLAFSEPFSGSAARRLPSAPHGAWPRFSWLNSCPDPPNFVWRMNDCDLGVLEQSTGIFFEVLHWCR
jgi:hypothetical protein